MGIGGCWREVISWYYSFFYLDLGLGGELVQYWSVQNGTSEPLSSTYVPYVLGIV